MIHQQPQKTGIDFVIKRAFFYWKTTIFYQIVLSIMYFGILISVAQFAAEKLGLLDEYLKIIKDSQGNFHRLESGIKHLVNNPNLPTFSLILMLTQAFVFPLQVGIFKIYRKIDINESYNFNDILSGYEGRNFFVFVTYFIFFEGVSSILKPLVFLSPIWIIITIFVVPLMFFMNTSLLKSISYNLSALKVHFFPIIICLLVATLFKYLGFLFFGIGGLLTFPFTTAMIYALYSVVFSEKRP